MPLMLQNKWEAIRNNDRRCSQQCLVDIERADSVVREIIHNPIDQDAYPYSPFSDKICIIDYEKVPESRG